MEAAIPNINRVEIDSRITSEFAIWFRNYVSFVVTILLPK